METQGDGDLLISCFGDIITLDVDYDSPVTIDNEHVIAWDASLDYSIHVASAHSASSQGKDWSMNLLDAGKVLIQTRNIHNMADALRPFFPSSSSNS